MFGVNLGELSIIALVALLVIGPERLPQYAAQLGRVVREGRRMALGVREQVRDELGPEFDEVDWRKLDPRQYDPRRIVRDALSEAWEDHPPSRSRASGATPSRRATPGRPVQRSQDAGPPPFDADAT
ncbi:twin-arginine translocase TatA/TatE family subunit [Quadrisphaera sp. DSM 44207]|uniref:twin-arginine translocase TatA/TatE family subunit n=1 Tax=Quadrisphaera sp. DSM 44207 TaxID=1881057 RepID=UPI00088FF44C|nr:twin-arginine translocase TatA/TatE family subunit [Quadrisphaera sp. DSM 44207]SDQ71587.1 sec-independent protein translocase protein TatB [Quadrisphaera sp. DSM 44207]